jgi:hypothetical protein
MKIVANFPKKWVNFPIPNPNEMDFYICLQNFMSWKLI